MSDLKDRAMPTVVEVAPRNDRELTIARLIDASPEALYRCWTEPALLVQWFAPRPLTTEVREMDLRVGGRQVIVMRGPDGAEYPAGGVFLELVPGRKLVFTDAFEAGWIPRENPMMCAEISFEARGDKTLYAARAGHWTAEAKAQHEAMGFHDGWGICAEQLAEVARSL